MTDKRDHILNVAERLFYDLGYAGTSTRLLAREAEVNLGMLSYYFGTKEKIMEALIERRIIRMRQVLTSIGEDKTDHWGNIEKIVELFVQQYLTDPGWYRFLFREFSMNPPNPAKAHAMQLILGNAQQIEMIVREGINAGVFRETDVQMLLLSLIGSIMHVLKNPEFSRLFTGQDPYINGQLCPIFRNRITSHLKDMARRYLQKEAI